MKNKKKVTEKQLAANRGNDGKSTGPRTDRGKRIARMNALKHGMTAREVLLLKGPMAENRKQFDALVRRVHRAWSPVGEAEEMRVEEIVRCEWLVLRSLRCENGYIHRNARIEMESEPLELSALKLATGREEDDAMQRELQSLTDHLALPLGPGLDQIMRYRQATLRERDRAIVELERLQRIRQGEQVAAPLKVQLSNDN